MSGTNPVDVVLPADTTPAVIAEHVASAPVAIETAAATESPVVLHTDTPTLMGGAAGGLSFSPRPLA